MKTDRTGPDNAAAFDDHRTIDDHLTIDNDRLRRDRRGSHKNRASRLDNTGGEDGQASQPEESR